MFVSGVAGSVEEDLFLLMVPKLVEEGGARMSAEAILTVRQLTTPKYEGRVKAR